MKSQNQADRSEGRNSVGEQQSRQIRRQPAGAVKDLRSPNMIISNPAAPMVRGDEETTG